MCICTVNSSDPCRQRLREVEGGLRSALCNLEATVRPGGRVSRRLGADRPVDLTAASLAAPIGAPRRDHFASSICAVACAEQGGVAWGGLREAVDVHALLERVWGGVH
eukprot:6244384-Pyramimonas_sp.AAC.1